MAQEQFNKLGHHGKWSSAESISGEVWFTGSNYGQSAVLRGSGASGSLHLSGGGVIDIASLDAGVIHELGVEHTENVGGGTFYVLKQN